MAIKKMVCTLVVLYDDEDFGPDEVPDASLEKLCWAITDGPAMGRFEVDSIDDVPKEKVEDEEIAMGGDGTFFTMLDGVRVDG